ncbi:MAG: hypothetical protein UT24_C0015G0009 [Candidatus Woesebacteria bacterium GW2011_GWB1_39_12]|uniref:Uncharacterized protein n=1 Tax=Candidatus Woesebacteria bacterium GW2011_GWB1_39_12 TaxID=1618574 RepID=A0A0G0MIM2_9BACT|nr:MAG: hypothetical protein UT24_C0015G0009 [Candidatus Woesebacteria bacterium GW2011_GWB1_39_12]
MLRYVVMFALGIVVSAAVEEELIRRNLKGRIPDEVFDELFLEIEEEDESVVNN